MAHVVARLDPGQAFSAIAALCANRMDRTLVERVITHGDEREHSRDVGAVFAESLRQKITLSVADAEAIVATVKRTSETDALLLELKKTHPVGATLQPEDQGQPAVTVMKWQVRNGGATVDGVYLADAHEAKDQGGFDEFPEDYTHQNETPRVLAVFCHLTTDLSGRWHLRPAPHQGRGHALHQVSWSLPFLQATIATARPARADDGEKVALASLLLALVQRSRQTPFKQRKERQPQKQEDQRQRRVNHGLRAFRHLEEPKPLEENQEQQPRVEEERQPEEQPPVEEERQPEEQPPVEEERQPEEQPQVEKKAEAEQLQLDDDDGEPDLPEKNQGAPKRRSASSAPLPRRKKVATLSPAEQWARDNLQLYYPMRPAGGGRWTTGKLYGLSVVDAGERVAHCQPTASERRQNAAVIAAATECTALPPWTGYQWSTQAGECKDVHISHPEYDKALETREEAERIKVEQNNLFAQLLVDHPQVDPAKTVVVVLDTAQLRTAKTVASVLPAGARVVALNADKAFVSAAGATTDVTVATTSDTAMHTTNGVTVHAIKASIGFWVLHNTGGWRANQCTLWHDGCSTVTGNGKFSLDHDLKGFLYWGLLARHNGVLAVTFSRRGSSRTAAQDVAAFDERMLDLGRAFGYHFRRVAVQAYRLMVFVAYVTGCEHRVGADAAAEMK